jgi:hypothetical protein
MVIPATIYGLKGTEDNSLSVVCCLFMSFITVWRLLCVSWKKLDTQSGLLPFHSSLNHLSTLPLDYLWPYPQHSTQRINMSYAHSKHLSTNADGKPSCRPLAIMPFSSPFLCLESHKHINGSNQDDETKDVDNEWNCCSCSTSNSSSAILCSSCGHNTIGCIGCFSY